MDLAAILGKLTSGIFLPSFKVLVPKGISKGLDEMEKDGETTIQSRWFAEDYRLPMQDMMAGCGRCIYGSWLSNEPDP